jgi:hypothetical protein
MKVKGIKVGSVSIDRDSEGKEKITGNYSLISEIDKVIAKQSFNGYSDIEVAWSSDTITIFNNFMLSIKKDIQNTLGLED